MLGHLDQFDEKEQGEIRAHAAKADTDLIEKAKGAPTAEPITARQVVLRNQGP